MPKKLTTEKFIEKAKQVHGNKYDYSKVEYVNNCTEICIICPEHGEFWQKPEKHLRGHGCTMCCKTGIKSNTDDFIKKAKKIHGDKYDYSKVNYINNHTKVCIICPEHGEFWQTPNSHLNGNGCFKCSYVHRGKEKRMATEEFIRKAKQIHGDKYDYSKVEYINCNEKICIICPKHGEVFTNPRTHLTGFGCPKCHQSFMERKIESLLEKNNINYIYECSKKNLWWLNKQRLDFYLPDYNVAIECQGKQHFQIRERFGGINGFEQRIKSDERKKNICKENGVILLYYADYDYDFPYDVITNEAELLNYIRLFGGVK